MNPSSSNSIPGTRKLSRILAPAAVLLGQSLFGQSLINLGTLGGTLSANYSEAFGINDAGQVTGVTGSPTAFAEAFLYSGGVMKDLGTLGGGGSDGFGINNSGQVT